MKERHLLIGTAGHVDHGKTQLIQCLTGISTDRLKEEKERGISIELGFAHLILPDGRKAGIVDVPGHEKFVRQMLAGASGMDVVLLVIAADEGIMPQTKEHLNILNLLEVANGIVVLTKIDLVDDEWLTMIELDIREKLKGSFLENAPVCRVSSVTSDGIPELLQTIVGVLTHARSRRTDFPARMPIDRVFTIQGFGTVVTGTLSSGVILKGQEMILEPAGITTKVRTIQVHGEKKDMAVAGQRAAINVSGVSVNEIDRGNNLVAAGYYDKGQVLDIEIFNLQDETRSIKHRQRVHFYLGTTENMGRIHLLDRNEINPGEKAYAQIILEQPVMVVFGEKFVIRYYSPVTTIGGGTVLGLSAHKKRRFRDSVIEEFLVRAKGDPREIVVQELFNPCTLCELTQKTKLGQDEIQSVLDALEMNLDIVVIKEDKQTLYWKKSSAENWGKKIALAAISYKKANPLRVGISRDEIKKVIQQEYTNRRWQHLLEWCEENQFITLRDKYIIGLPEVDLPVHLKKQIDCLKQLWERESLNPPDLEKGLSICGITSSCAEEYANYLVSNEIWLHIDSYYFSTKAIEHAKNSLVDYLNTNGQISVAEARDLWKTSRKFAVPILEYLDSVRITRRNNVTRTLY